MARNQTSIDRKLLDVLLDELDSEYMIRLGPSGPPKKLHMLIVGGAALITRFGHRSTTDVDALTPVLPPELVSTVKALATRHGMEDDWLNNAVSRDSSQVGILRDRPA